jgi:exonuclease SbcD
VRGTKATKAETALLQEAVDGCCHDPDQDVLVGVPAPGRGASDDAGATG